MNESDESLALDGEANCSTWDAIVIGAGPAGSLAARELALAGLETLLIDAKKFPREKVCGGYLNSRALGALREAGLIHIAGSDRESEVTELELIRGRQRTRFRLPAGRVICRAAFDDALMLAAKSAGAHVLTGAQAVVELAERRAPRCVTIIREGRQELLNARVVICADGLSRSSVRQLPECAASTAPTSRVGIGAVVSGDFDLCPAGQLRMILSRSAYVGISRAGDRQFNIAAAVDRNALLRTTPSKIVADIFAQAGTGCPPEIEVAHWRGTPPLTSRPKHVATARVFLIGDSGGYIEPFTGEGMAFAMEAAAAVAPLAIEATQSWEPAIAEKWIAVHQQMVRNRQRTCQQLAWILRRPWAAYLTLGVCRMAPRIAERLIERTTFATNHFATTHCRPGKIGTT